MKNINDDIKAQIIQVINKTIFAEKKKRFTFNEITLYPSEVHLMLVIKNKINTNATEIAKQLGLTKGAISQTISRLEKKGIIAKTKDPYNKNELTLSLTTFGKEAYTSCRTIETSFIESHDDYLAKLAPEEKEVILNFLQHLEKTIEGLEPA